MVEIHVRGAPAEAAMTIGMVLDSPVEPVGDHRFVIETKDDFVFVSGYGKDDAGPRSVVFCTQGETVLAITENLDVIEVKNRRLFVKQVIENVWPMLPRDRRKRLMQRLHAAGIDLRNTRAAELEITCWLSEVMKNPTPENLQKLAALLQLSGKGIEEVAGVIARRVRFFADFCRIAYGDEWNTDTLR